MKTDTNDNAGADSGSSAGGRPIMESKQMIVGPDKGCETRAVAASLSASAGSGLTDTQRLNWLESNKTIRVEWWEDAQFRDYCMVLVFSEADGMKEVNDHFQHYDLREAIDYAIEQISFCEQ